MKKNVKNESLVEEKWKNEVKQFVAWYHADKKECIPFQRNRNIKIYGILKGSAEIVITDEKKTLAEGELACVDVLESHSHIIEEKTDYFVIEIGMKYLRDFFRTYPNKRLPRWLLDEAYNETIFKYVKPSLAADKIVNSELRKVVFVNEVLASIAEYYGTLEKKRLSAYDENAMLEIIRYIEMHYAEKITLNSLAEKFYMSPKNLSKKLSRYLDTDLRVFVNDIRVQKAIAMRDDPQHKEKTMEEIIELCGFDSIRTFYRSYERNFKTK